MRNDEQSDDRDHGKKGSQTNWLLDDRGRRYYMKSSGEKVYYDSDERDSAVEEQYRPCAELCCSNLLVRIMTHRDDIVAEYLRYCMKWGIGEKVASEALGMFEEERFGEKCYPSAHTMLLRYVKEAVFEKRESEKLEPYLRALKVIPPDQCGKLDLFDYLHEVAKAARVLDSSVPKVAQFPNKMADAEVGE